MDEEQKKVSLPEIIMLTIYIGITDIIGIILVCFALDDFWILDALTFPVTQIYFRIKKVSATVDLSGNIAELVPYLGALPIRTICMLVNIYIANNPEKWLSKKIQKAATIGGVGSIGKSKAAGASNAAATGGGKTAGALKTAVK
jgi:hypothetical protein